MIRNLQVIGDICIMMAGGKAQESFKCLLQTLAKKRPQQNSSCHIANSRSLHQAILSNPGISFVNKVMLSKIKGEFENELPLCYVVIWTHMSRYQLNIKLLHGCA